ncbi:MAG: hypothetical protein AAGI11_01695 [Pseudomonadota bacterium]
MKRYLVPLLLGLISVDAAARIGDYRYACQVMTISKQEGYVSIRADSMEEARVMALRSESATTRGLKREPVDRLLECIELPEGRFTSPGFRQWVERDLPR